MLSKAKEAIRQSRRVIIDQMKLQSGCMDCGYNLHAVALDFDHLVPSEKKFNISQSIVNHSWESILLEIAKCQVVCSNCHRIREHTRREANNGNEHGEHRLVGSSSPV